MLTMLPLALEQVRDRGLREEEAAVDVDAHHLAVGALVDLGEVLGPRDAGDVAEHVEATELLDGRRDGGDALVAAADVAGATWSSAAPASATSLAVSAEGVAVEVVREDLGALGREAHGHCPTDPRTRAGDPAAFPRSVPRSSRFPLVPSVSGAACPRAVPYRSMSGPLTGVKVVELAGLGALPFGTLKLADMGADVIRVDRAGEVPAAPPDPPKGFSEWDRGRRSIGVDLKHPDGVEVVLRLAEQADALLESFRPGVAERLGVGPDAALARNPKLVYGRLTGWGQDGPLASSADTRSTTSRSPVRSGRWVRPRRAGAGAPGARRLRRWRSAPRLRRRVPRCSRRSVPARARWSTRRWSMVWRRSSRCSTAWRARACTPRTSGPISSTAARPSTRCTRPPTAKYVTLAPIEPHFYAQLLEQLGIAGDDLPAQYDQSHWPEMKERIAAAVRTKTRAEWEAQLSGTDVCFAPVYRFGEAHEHPHNVAPRAVRPDTRRRPPGRARAPLQPHEGGTGRLVRLPGRRHRRGARRVRVRRPRGRETPGRRRDRLIRITYTHGRERRGARGVLPGAAHRPAQQR